MAKLSDPHNRNTLRKQCVAMNAVRDKLRSLQADNSFEREVISMLREHLGDYQFDHIQEFGDLLTEQQARA